MSRMSGPNLLAQTPSAVPTPTVQGTPGQEAVQRASEVGRAAAEGDVSVALQALRDLWDGVLAQLPLIRDRGSWSAWR